MGTLIWFTFWGILALLVAAAGVRAYLRRKAWFAAMSPRLDDEAVRRIVQTGALSLEDDEPLDLREIGEEEERFWSETWDEPEESDFGKGCN